MLNPPIYRVACPCCASNVVEVTGHCPLKVWSCTGCGFSMMGLAVPFVRRDDGRSRPMHRPGEWRTTAEVYEATQTPPLTRNSAPPPWFAVVGHDGTRQIVWGLGQTEESALRDARGWISPNDKQELHCHRITEAQAERITRGAIEWPLLDLVKR